MSVEAINGVDPQRQGNPIGTAIAGGLGLGAVGATTGYFIGNKRPNLEEVFKQTPDVFTSNEVVAKDAQAAQELQQAAKEYKDAGQTERGLLKTEAKKVLNTIKNQHPTNEADLNNTKTTAENNFKNKKVKITLADGTEKEVTRTDVLDKLENATTDADKAAARKEAKAYFNHADVAAEKKAYIDAKKALTKAKVDAAKAVDANLFNDVNAKRTEFANARTTKLTEILNRDNIKQAFEKIKEALPKQGGKKWAMIAGGIAAAVGLIGGYIIGGNNKA